MSSALSSFSQFVLSFFSFWTNTFPNNLIKRFSSECWKWSGNYFGFGCTTVWDWLRSLIGKEFIWFWFYHTQLKNACYLIMYRFCKTTKQTGSFFWMSNQISEILLAWSFPFSGDPSVFGNLEPCNEMISAVVKSVKQSKHNGYAPSTGIQSPLGFFVFKESKN